MLVAVLFLIAYSMCCSSNRVAGSLNSGGELLCFVLIRSAMLTRLRSAPSDDGVQWLASERFSGTYRRQVSLGEGIDVTKIVANYDNGVLSVTIPLAEEAKPRKIVVESTGRQQAITANASG